MGLRARLFASVCLAVAALAPSPGRAQPAEAASEVGEVIVTAQRREQRLIDVPIAITAASKDELLARGVQDTRDLTTLAPGLNAATQGFAFQPSIRGIGTTSTAAGDETNVALYIDNVYMPFQAGNTFALKSIERIEVLKGPQGTLFGRNATGGAIRIITADPSFDPRFEASANYGFRLNSKELNAYATGGLSETVAIGLSAYAYDDDGYVRNLTDGDKVSDTRQVTLRGKLLATPTDNLRIVVEADYTNNISSAAFSTTIQDGVQLFKNVAGAIVPPDASVDPYTVALTFDPYVKGLSAGSYLQIRYQAAGHTLTSTSAYREFKLKAFLDSDRTNLDLSQFHIFQSTKVLTQEVDLASNLDGPLNYVAGLYYYDSEARALATRNFAAPLSPVVGGVRRPLGPLVNNANTQGRVDTRSWAGFGELTWEVTEAFRLIGGYRYTWEKKDALARNALTGVQFTGSDKWTNSSIRATAQYNFAGESNVYVTYSTGFKSGAFNPTSVANPLQKVEPEEVRAWEAGVKARLGPFTVLASAFDYKYDNIQLQVNNILNPVAGTTILLNAATAEIRGADLQVGGRLTENLSVQVGVSWLPRARYTAFTGGLTFIPNPGGLGATPTVANLSGSRMIRAPELTFDIGGVYRAPLAGGKLQLSANYFWSDDFFWLPGGAVQQDEYGTLNARAAWTTPDERFTFSVWARNLTNELYWLQAGANSGGFSGSYAQPREIGVGFDVAF